MEILGIFNNVEDAAHAIDELIESGFDEQGITSVTSVPYPDGVLVHLDRKSWFHWLTIAGGVSGAILGLLLAAGTAWLYPLQTGDKPIVALFPTGIITYEFMMLGALLGTFFGMLLEMKLPAFNRRANDPEIADGLIGISITVDDTNTRQQAESVMLAANALKIRDNEVMA